MIKEKHSKKMGIWKFLFKNLEYLKFKTSIQNNPFFRFLLIKTHFEILIGFNSFYKIQNTFKGSSGFYYMKK